MREILNPWTKLDNYNCFGCSPNNPNGLRMRFFVEDADDQMGDVVSIWQPQQVHQSWINTLHGGAQATLLDEVCGWVVFYRLQTSGVTAKMELRYKKTVSTICGPIVLRARLKSLNHKIAVVEGSLADKDGNILTTCECTYYAFLEDKAKEMGYLNVSLSEEDYTLEQVVEMIKQPVYRSLKV